ncbi:serine protease [Methylosinus sp. Sm6]|uniref:S1 family peptidase n=1 Tax=Methylosinus sp. Sm6 TaxID=2866948 RepID=UPI001C997EEC|nr:serine protease [Methylosinus sp. Sm6]MBY6241849.1 serine protease [Methylosinus sp. Sm6]
MSNEPLLLTATRVCTFEGPALLTNASGFFFAREERLFLVTSRHVLSDAPSKHFPDRIEIELHVDADNLAKAENVSIALYGGENRQPRWRQGVDGGGEVDVAAMEIAPGALPEAAVYRAFTPAHLCRAFDRVEIGSSVLVVGFPLGFHDTLHHMPVARQGVVASSFGLRFQGLGYFLTDARTHRGASGAPVVARVPALESIQGDLPWTLLGVHSARLDVGSRDIGQDEALGLNCAWYADILLTLTEA